VVDRDHIHQGLFRIHLQRKLLPHGVDEVRRRCCRLRCRLWWMPVELRGIGRVIAPIQ
jgi:hypothetical protein